MCQKMKFKNIIFMRGANQKKIFYICLFHIIFFIGNPSLPVWAENKEKSLPHNVFKIKILRTTEIPKNMMDRFTQTTFDWSYSYYDTYKILYFTIGSFFSGSRYEKKSIYIIISELWKERIVREIIENSNFFEKIKIEIYNKVNENSTQAFIERCRKYSEDQKSGEFIVSPIIAGAKKILSNSSIEDDKIFHYLRPFVFRFILLSIRVLELLSIFLFFRFLRNSLNDQYGVFFSLLLFSIIYYTLDISLLYIDSFFNYTQVRSNTLLWIEGIRNEIAGFVVDEYFKKIEDLKKCDL